MMGHRNTQVEIETEWNLDDDIECYDCNWEKVEIETEWNLDIPGMRSRKKRYSW